MVELTDATIKILPPPPSSLTGVPKYTWAGFPNSGNYGWKGFGRARKDLKKKEGCVLMITQLPDDTCCISPNAGDAYFNKSSPIKEEDNVSGYPAQDTDKEGV